MNQMDRTQTCQFGVIGLGAMGANFALNVAENEMTVIGVDPEIDRVNEFCQQGSSFEVTGTTSLKEFVAALEAPRKILLLVPAGKTVDTLIEELVPLLQPGDVLLDGGNSFFGDTDRRFNRLAEIGIEYLGVGISGGAEGARHGASIMPGGSASTYALVQPILESVAAKAEGTPCVDLIGDRSAGHYVKMVHNGIEYALMQLIAESYDVLKKFCGLSNEQLANTFEAWNDGELSSFLIEITARIFRQADDLADGDLIDVIKDKAKQKGTGQWTSQDAFSLGIPVPTIHAAVVARATSSFESQRRKAHDTFGNSEFGGTTTKEVEPFVDDVRDALLFSYILSYDQGLRLISAASQEYNYGVNLETCARIWRNGCIIRAKMLEDIRAAYQEHPDLESLMFSPTFATRLNQLQGASRRVSVAGIEQGIPLPAITASLGYFDSFKAGQLPLNLVQAQRDLFGMHSYERRDRPGTFRTEWK